MCNKFLFVLFRFTEYRKPELAHKQTHVIFSFFYISWTQNLHLLITTIHFVSIRKSYLAFTSREKRKINTCQKFSAGEKSCACQPMTVSLYNYYFHGFQSITTFPARDIQSTRTFNLFHTITSRKQNCCVGFPSISDKHSFLLHTR